MSSEPTGQFILLCFAIFIIFWIIAAFSTKRTVEGRGWPQSIWLAIAIVGFVLFFRVRTRPLPLSNVLWSHTRMAGIVADVVTLVGLFVTLWARIVLGRNWSSGVVFKERHELIQCGPYAYVRHPIYSGCLLMILGMAIFLGTVSGFISLGAVFVGFWIKALQEEKLLTRHFKEAYPQYKARVKALVPFLW